MSVQVSSLAFIPVMAADNGLKRTISKSGNVISAMKVAISPAKSRFQIFMYLGQFQVTSPSYTSSEPIATPSNVRGYLHKTAYGAYA